MDIIFVETAVTLTSVLLCDGREDEVPALGNQLQLVLPLGDPQPGDLGGGVGLGAAAEPHGVLAVQQRSPH